MVYGSKKTFSCLQWSDPSLQGPSDSQMREHWPMKNLWHIYTFEVTHWGCAVWSECCHLVSQTLALTDRALKQTRCIQIRVGSCPSSDAWTLPVLDVTSWCHRCVGSSPWDSQAWKWYVQWTATANYHHGPFASGVCEERYGCGRSEKGSTVRKTYENKQYWSVALLFAHLSHHQTT